MADDSDDDDVDPARRRLLGMAKYVPPAVLGIIALQQAGCQNTCSCTPAPGPNCVPCSPPSCLPSLCQPNIACGPWFFQNPCGPSLNC